MSKKHYKKPEDRDAISKVIDTSLQYGATASECQLSLRMAGYDWCTKTIERFIADKYNCTFGEHRNYMMGVVRLKIKEKIVSTALQGNTALLIFAAKNLCGWADKVENKIEEKPTKELIEQAKDLIREYERKDEESKH